jgi:hypothetical protein
MMTKITTSASTDRNEVQDNAERLRRRQIGSTMTVAMNSKAEDRSHRKELGNSSLEARGIVSAMITRYAICAP